MNKYFLLSFLLLGFFWSCSDSELITPGDEFLPPTEIGTYTVEINGVFTDFSDITSATSSAESSQIRGQNTINQTSVITIQEALSVGVFTQEQGATIIINLGSAGVFTNVDANNQLLPFNVTITSVNTAQGLVTGAFSGTVYNPISDETRTLTNGKFVQIQFQPSPQSDALLKANFNDTAFDFSNGAHAMGIQTAAVIQGENTDQIQTLSITVPGGIGIGSYTEENNVIFQVNLGTSTNPSDVYTNYNAVTDTFLPVTLNITAVTTGDNARVLGTFSGTITKFTNGVPGEEITVSQGQINVPVVIP